MLFNRERDALRLTSFRAASLGAFVILLLAAAADDAHPRLQAQGGVRALPADTAERSTADGVYTLAQANQGKDIFASACQSCHSPTVHSGPPFRKNWFGKPLGDLFGYLRREMPKADPGTMSDEEYSLIVAYLLRINDMPTGSEPLAADSVSLHRIRLDSVPASPTR
jgi:mono/diheme cytochrome c family protein